MWASWNTTLASLRHSVFSKRVRGFPVEAVAPEIRLNGAAAPVVAQTASSWFLREAGAGWSARPSSSRARSVSARVRAPGCSGSARRDCTRESGDPVARNAALPSKMASAAPKHTDRPIVAHASGSTRAPERTRAVRYCQIPRSTVARMALAPSCDSSPAVQGRRGTAVESIGQWVGPRRTRIHQNGYPGGPQVGSSCGILVTEF